MNKNDYIDRVKNQIYFIYDRKIIEEELNQHFQDSIEDLLSDGLSKEEAEKLAVLQMGDPVEVGKLLNKEHHPLLGYLWKLSQVILIILIIQTCMLSFSLFRAFDLLVPMTIENSVETIELDREFDIPTHHVKLDAIHLGKDGRYYLTYRSWIDYSYSRASWYSMRPFRIENSSGKWLEGQLTGDDCFLGVRDVFIFELPEDGMIILNRIEGEDIKLNVREMFYE